MRPDGYDGGAGVLNPPAGGKARSAMDQKASPAALRDAVIDRIVDTVLASGSVGELTDKYFTNTRLVVEANGDTEVTYAIFLRRRSISALEPVVRLISRLVPEATVTRHFPDGEIVPSERKMLDVTGPMSKLSEVETLLLQKTGFPCISANNAYEMCRAMPNAGFVDMHARHASGAEMNLLVAYGAAVGSEVARAADPKAKGFIGSSLDLTAPLFGSDAGIGTMPHALVGYTKGDVLEALKLFEARLPEIKGLVALVDYRGLEITDALRCAEWFYREAGLDKAGKTFAVRLDTHGGRFAEGLDYEKSVDIVGHWLGVEGEYNIVERVLGARAFQLDPSNILVDKVRRILFGKGISVASIIHSRQVFDEAGFADARIVASSGFDPQKCQVMGAAKAPVDIVGTGSFLPATLTETYATADVISYGGVKRVKVGREFLLD
jgi:nicotinate phosphoribosyltransferase